MSYLPVVAEEAVNCFRTSLPDFDNEVWFEYEGIPLKANLPIGVIFDLVFKKDVSDLPWNITIHYRGFPADKIMKCGSKAVALKTYAHSIKQSLYLLTGNTRPFNELSIIKQNQIWEAICT
eukprot:gene13029-27494_t